MDKRYFTKSLVKWYQHHKRDLPWRSDKDPYKIWLSEIILQQTRVNQGLPYYHRFLEKFPDIQHFARAQEQEILSLWQGLGYYSRARNMHACARTIANDYNGAFPRTAAELIKLPGIGPYTAAAIASFAFGEVVPVIDGNVYRVLARVFGLDTPINSPAATKVFLPLAQELIDAQDPAIYNQAIMEFGALHCKPRNPDCPECPFQQGCFSKTHDLVEALPVKLKARESTRVTLDYLVIHTAEAIWMKQRDKKDIWYALWDFPVVGTDLSISGKSSPAILRKLPEPGTPYKHVLSHRIIEATFRVLQLPATEPLTRTGLPGEWVPLTQLRDLPKSVLITKFLVDEGILTD